MLKFKSIKRCLKSFVKFINEPRVLEIRFGLAKDFQCDDFIVIEEDEPIIKNIYEEIERENFVRNLNKQRTQDLIYQYIKKKYEADGLMPTEKQLQEDTQKAFFNYVAAGLIDHMNNLKRGAEEGILEAINK